VIAGAPCPGQGLTGGDPGEPAGTHPNITGCHGVSGGMKRDSGRTGKVRLLSCTPGAGKGSMMKRDQGRTGKVRGVRMHREGP
jgi:hypothetical protein